ncbi:MAG: hypothetical protein WKG03_16435 [Telluria sp.]
MQWLIERIEAVLSITEAEAWAVMMKLHEYFDPKWSMGFSDEDVRDLIISTASMMDGA